MDVVGYEMGWEEVCGTRVMGLARLTRPGQTRLPPIRPPPYIHTFNIHASIHIDRYCRVYLYLCISIFRSQSQPWLPSSTSLPVEPQPSLRIITLCPRRQSRRTPPDLFHGWRNSDPPLPSFFSLPLLSFSPLSPHINIF